MEPITNMDHREALELMATERYLLNELSPELRDAYEEHLFDCPDCALDLRAAEAFVTEAKVQLPELTAQPANPQNIQPNLVNIPKKSPFSWLKPIFSTPAFAAPVFATLLLILGYQNFVTYPALRSEVKMPSIQPWLSLHTGTRGAAHVPVEADRVHGVMLLLDLPNPDLPLDPKAGTDPVRSLPAIYTSYTVQLSDADHNSTWAQTIPATQVNAHEGTVSLLIPGAGIRQGAYTLTVFGITASGQRNPIQHQILDFQIIG